MKTEFENLPQALPVFPLPCVLLLPRGQLPLNIFETRYINMVDEALQTNRMIGMVQPRTEEDHITEIYDTGCAGRITEFSETEDGGYLITLTGICRFKVVEEIEAKQGFRRVHPDWVPFRDDFQEEDCLGLDRDSLKSLLQSYFKKQDLSCDWDAIDEAPDERLMTCLSMICPLDAREKQALLETVCCHERAKKFMTMLEMAVHQDRQNVVGDIGHH